MPYVAGVDVGGTNIKLGLGAAAHGPIMSLMPTLRLQGKNVSDSLRLAFLRHRQGFTAPCLSLGTG